MRPIGVYFSPASRDYDADDFLPAYRGALVLLLQAHREFQVVTPRTLAAFHGEKLLLPSVSVLGEGELKVLREYTENGGRLVITGKNATGMGASGQVREFVDDPGKKYFAELQKDFSAASGKMPGEFLRSLEVTSEMTVDGPPTVAVNMARVDGAPHAFLANFGGLMPAKVAQPTPVPGIHVRIPAAAGNTLVFLPFLGKQQIVKGVPLGEKIEFALPVVERGAVLWVEKQ